MKVVVVATRADKPAEEFAPHMAAESKMALGMYAEDFVREIYSRQDGMGAILVLEAANEDEVKSRLDELPLAKAGLLTFEIYGVAPYRGIAAAANA